MGARWITSHREIGKAKAGADGGREGQDRGGIAGIARAIAVEIGLVGVGNGRAVVPAAADPVAIRVNAPEEGGQEPGQRLGHDRAIADSVVVAGGRGCVVWFSGGVTGRI